VESCLPPIRLQVMHKQRLAAIRIGCSLPDLNPATACLHPSFPSLTAYRAKDCSRALTKGLTSVYLPLNQKTPRPTPPMRNHLPVDAVADRTIPFTHGLSRMPMIYLHLFSPALATPPLSLIDNTYLALKKTLREALLDEWVHLFPTPGYYHHLPALNPRAFMVMSKFMAGRIHQMRACKCYLAAHHTWRNPDADTRGPRSVLDPATFEYTILSCHFSQRARSSLLHSVNCVGHQDPIWTSLPLLKSLVGFITVTSTGFPPTIFPLTTPPSSLRSLLSPPAVPPPRLSCFFVGRGLGHFGVYLSFRFMRFLLVV